MMQRDSEAPASLAFQGLSYIEIWARGSPFHFQLADKIFHDNKDRCRLLLRHSSIKASVMRSDESWEFQTAQRGASYDKVTAEGWSLARDNFSVLTSGDIGWIFPLILHLTPVMTFLLRSAHGCSRACFSSYFKSEFAYLTVTHLPHPCHQKFELCLQYRNVLTHLDVFFYTITSSFTQMLVWIQSGGFSDTPIVL